jgi:hypothetical protein
LLLIFSVSLARGQKDSVYYGETKSEKQKREKNEDRSRQFREKVFYGGNTNLFISNQVIAFNLNPAIGYKVSEKVQIGAGLMATFYSTHVYGRNYTTLFYGPHTFARYFITDGIYLQAQYDKLNQPVYNYSAGSIERGWIDYFLAGGGVMRHAGDHSFVVASIMWNFIARPGQPSAYYNPLITFGFYTSI